MKSIKTQSLKPYLKIISTKWFRVLFVEIYTINYFRIRCTYSTSAIIVATGVVQLAASLTNNKFLLLIWLKFKREVSKKIEFIPVLRDKYP